MMPSLAIKYRPKRLKQVKGNEHLLGVVKRLLNKKDKPQTYILKGERGCGKTTIARIMADKLGGKGRDLKEINLSDMRGIDTARQLIENVGYMPMDGDSKVIILNEAHKSTDEFQNAMLEKLEEPPAGVYFIICTTRPDKLLGTILSRCALAKYTIKPLTRRELTAVVNRVLKREEIEWETNHVKMLVRLSEGIPREALTLLDGLIELKGNRLGKALKEVQRQTKELPIALARAITQEIKWGEVARILKGLEQEDAEGVRRIVLKYLRKVLLNNPSGHIAHAIECFEDNFYDSGPAGLFLASYKSLVK